MCWSRRPDRGRILPAHFRDNRRAPAGSRRVRKGATNMTEELATLGGGCFWCLEAVFKDLRGVSAVKSGYAGGDAVNPTYKQVCTGRTGHAEVVQIRFDPAAVSYGDLLRVFFTIHDPTTRDRQGHDVGSQYRSVILTHGDAQRAMADAVMAEVAQAKLWPAPLVTEVMPLDAFYPAEPEHDDYFARNPWTGYCQAVVGPKVAKFRKTFADRLKREAAE
jgi:peptide-methionine (S)-S-oxide reductase